METRIHYRPQAERDLDSLFDYIASRAGIGVATRFLNRILEICRSLETFPKRGAPRPSLGKGIRLLGMKRRVSIIYLVTETRIEIVRVFYGGQDIAERLSER